MGLRLHDQQRVRHLAAHALQQVFQLPLQTALAYGWITSAVGVIASIICALMIDKVGRKPWYATAFLLATLPLLTLSWLGATSAIEVLILATATYAILQTIAFSLYLYSAELYPTRLRAVGTGFGSAWLRAGSSMSVRSWSARSSRTWVFGTCSRHSPRSRWSAGSSRSCSRSKRRAACSRSCHPKLWEDQVPRLLLGISRELNNFALAREMPGHPPIQTHRAQVALQLEVSKYRIGF